MENTNEVGEIRVWEIVQARDVFLLALNCPKCGVRQLVGADHLVVSCCSLDLSDYAFTLPGHRKNRRLLAGTVRHKRGSKKISKKVVQALVTHQESQCAYCEVSLDGVSYHVDHVVPLAVGGTNNFSNLVVACAPCNLVAGSKYFPDFLNKKDYVLARRLQKSA